MATCKNCYRDIGKRGPEHGDVSTCHDCSQPLNKEDIDYIYSVHQKKLDAIGLQDEQERAMSKWCQERGGSGPMLKEFEDYFQAYMDAKRANEGGL
jgi:hypothetical protein